MTPAYTVGRITHEKIIPAFALVNLVAPGLDLEGWRSFCRESLSRTAPGADEDDVVIATNPLGYVQGLSIGAIRRHVAYGRILDVSIFLVTSAADDVVVATELLDYLKERAEAEGCKAMRIWTFGNGDEGLNLPERKGPEHGVLWVLGPAGQQAV